MSVDFGPGPITPLHVEPTPETKEDRRRRRRERNSERDAAREAARARKRRITRWVTLAVLLVIAGVIAVPIRLWSQYSTTFVTSSNATVKGSITQVGAQISGVVASVEVEPGQHVKAGQVLARFEDHILQGNILRARSRLAEASARARAAGTKIEAAQTQSQEAYVRYYQRVPLAKNGAISQDELRTAETRLRTSQANERTTLADAHASRAEVSTAEADLAIAQADLAASVIRAPADGRVVRRISEPGASVVVGQPVVALWIGKEVWVEAWIAQDDLSKVVVGSDVDVTLSSFPGRTFRGKVASIGVSTDFELPESAVPQSRRERMRATPVVPVRVQLEDTAGLMPGLSAVVAIHRTPKK